MEKLKPKEQMVYDYIARSVRELGYSPSVRDICRDLGYKSTSTVQMYLNRLALFGYITKEDGKSRTITPASDAPRVCTLPVYRLSDVNALGDQAAVVGHTSYLGDLESEKLFSLVCENNDLVSFGINCGDILVFERAVYADDGEMVLLRVNNSFSVKHFYRENGKYVTEDSISKKYSEEADIVGRLVSLTRKFGKGTLVL